MQDAFAQLQLPRRPWLDENEVRAAFQRVAARVHPDASGTEEAFGAITQAYQTLREPASRLKHLISLELPDAAPASGMPPDVIKLFPVIAHAREKVERWTQRMATARTTLERAVAGAEFGKIRAECETACNQVDAAVVRAIDQLRSVDSRWPSAAAREELPPLQARLAFLEKWQAQLREARLRLDIGAA